MKNLNGKSEPWNGKWNEIQAVLLFAAALLIFISLASFNFSDLKQFTSRPNVPVGNFAGIFGAYFGAGLFFIMGLSSYVMPLLVLSWAIARLFGITPQKLHFKVFGTFFLILASSSLFSIIGSGGNSFRFSLGGIVGLAFSDFLIKYLGKGGAILVIAVLFLLSLILATEFLLLPFLSGIYRKFKGLPVDIKEKVFTRYEPSGHVINKKPVININLPGSKARTNGESRAFGEIRPRGVMESLKSAMKPEKAGKEERPRIITMNTEQEAKPSKTAVAPAPLKSVISGSGKESANDGYKLPSLDLLDSPPPISSGKVKEDFETTARILEETLRDFDIEGKVVEINKGPVITRYELEPAPGVKVHRITSLSDNIALAMKAQSVRIEAPIPGKGTIGFEVPNSKSALVYLREVLDSKEYMENRSVLKLALGKDIAGTPVIADLAKMPHLLIAGTTGSGKSVCVYSLITSLLYNSTPDDVKFIMVDPKKVELTVFNDMPHLLSPVVTDVKKAASTLAWVASEMDSRYDLFAKYGVRNIALYNEKFGAASSKTDEDQPEKLPYIVVVIDELADLMMVSRDDVESTITRIAQLSRAVGIHMIIATQRPSVDVITGIIKANFPARISFKVASKVDSRTVLDMNGADMLLGRGDMLFIEPGAAKPVRAQCSLISDKELERITGFIKTQRAPQYVGDIAEVQKKTGSFKKFEKDEVYEEAVKLILESKQASVSVLQRRLGLGYTRAARLIDMMEDEGIVGPYQGSKPRDLLITLEEYQAKNGE